MKVKLQDVVEAMDLPTEEMSSYLNKRTGEVVMVTNEEFEAAEDEAAEDADDMADYPEWQRESILKAREIMDSQDWIALPEKNDIDDYAIMEEFCHSIADPEISDRLLSTIRGSGAFSRFRGALEALDMRQEWYDFRAVELEKIAVAWLEENEIECTRETRADKRVN